MKKILTILLSLCGLILSAQSPIVDTSFHYGNSVINYQGRHVIVKDMTLDNQGNSIMVGIFFDSLDMDPGLASVMVGRHRDTGTAFLQKLDPQGNLIWAHEWGTHNFGNNLLSDVVVDNNNDIIVKGRFWADKFHANPISFSGIHSGSFAEPTDIVIKLNSQGQYQWSVETVGVGFWSHAFFSVHPSLAVNSKNEILVNYAFTDSIDADPRPSFQNFIYNNSVGKEDILLQKLGANGNLIWNKVISGNAGIRAGISVFDSNDNIYLAGGYRSGSVDFDPDSTGTQMRYRNGQNFKSFVLKLTDAGDYQNVLVGEGAGVSLIRDLKFDQNGNVYVAGTYEGVTDLLPGSGSKNTKSKDGINSGYFIQKLDTSLTYQWSKYHITENTFHSGYLYRYISRKNNIKIFPHGNELYVAAGFSNKVYLQPDSTMGDSLLSPITASNTHYTSDLYFMRYQINTGEIKWKMVPKDSRQHHFTLVNLLEKNSQMLLSANVNREFTIDLVNGVKFGPTNQPSSGNNINVHSGLIHFKKCANSLDTIQRDTLVCGFYRHTDGYQYINQDTLPLPNRTYFGEYGCDSLVVERRVVVTSRFPKVRKTSPTTLTITPKQNMPRYYTWYSCSGDSIYSAGPNLVLNVTEPGRYALVYSDSLGCTDTNDCYDFTDISIDESVFRSSLTLFPNPVTNKLYLQFNDDTDEITVRLYSLKGQLIRKETYKDYVSVADMPQGVYIIEIESKSKGVTRRKILKK